MYEFPLILERKRIRKFIYYYYYLYLSWVNTIPRSVLQLITVDWKEIRII